MERYFSRISKGCADSNKRPELNKPENKTSTQLRPQQQPAQTVIFGNKTNLEAAEIETSGHNTIFSNTRETSLNAGPVGLQASAASGFLLRPQQQPAQTLIFGNKTRPNLEAAEIETSGQNTSNTRETSLNAGPVGLQASAASGFLLRPQQQPAQTVIFGNKTRPNLETAEIETSGQNTSNTRETSLNAGPVGLQASAASGFLLRPQQQPAQTLIFGNKTRPNLEAAEIETSDQNTTDLTGSKPPHTCLQDSQSHSNSGNTSRTKQIKRNKKTLLSFFASKKARTDTGNESESECINEQMPGKSTEEDTQHFPETEDTLFQINSNVTSEYGLDVASSSMTVETLTPKDIFEDIGDCLDVKLTDLQKYHLLKNHVQPSKGYDFPYSEHSKKGKIEKRYLKQSHLDAFKPWIVYSESKKGVFCICCALFAPTIIGRGSTNHPQSLVKVPVTNFAKLLGKDGFLNSHLRLDYHKKAIIDTEHFLTLFKNPKLTIQNRLNTARTQQIAYNRECLHPILKTIIFCGKQNIALRGHRDDGNLFREEIGSIVSNDGNFRNILRMRVESGDIKLQEQLKNAGSNATYISKTTQNDLIDCCGKEIVNKIIVRVKKAEFFSVIFDETTDISRKSQMTLIIRYINDGIVIEDFIGFADLHSKIYSDSESEPILTGDKIGEAVLEILSEVTLNIKKCVAIGTDGCSVMRSLRCGAVERIKKHATNAVWASCYNHNLNLSVSKCANILAVQNCFAVISEVSTFLRSSAKRNFVLLNVIGKCLVTLCQTRWVERHNCILSFCTNLKSIVDVLERIQTWDNDKSKNQASLLLKGILNSEFIVTIHVLKFVYSYTYPLSVIFQKHTLNFGKAHEEIQSVILAFDEKRNDADNSFESIWVEILSMSDELDSEIVKPRITKRQVHRLNYETSSVKEYFKCAIFIPLLDEISSDLKDRFNNDSIDALQLSLLLPTNSAKLNHTISLKNNSFFKMLNVNTTQFEAELVIWKLRWKDSDESIDDIEEILTNEFFVDAYPNIIKLIKIYFTIPASVASAERSFSALKRLKSWLRNRISEDRLTGLALLHVHYNENNNIEDIIDLFASKKGRKTDFILS